MKSSALRLVLFAISFFLLPVGAGAAESGVRFDLPVECLEDESCFIQNYVDHASGSEARDFTCGTLAYDRHTGTDFRVSKAAMKAGVPVFAASEGIVKAVRDGMPDIDPREEGAPRLEGREAGNGVVIDHGDGWETQYSHLRQGSVRVEPGQKVSRGDVIAQIGQSGVAEFPHVEFAARQNGQAIDPFTATMPESGCGSSSRTLWSPDAQRELIYRPGGLLDAGFAAQRPELERALQQGYPESTLTRQSPALVFWTLAWGLREGDVEEILLFGPDGRIIAEDMATLPRSKAQWMRFAGLKRPNAGWPAGQYRGEYRIFRTEDGKRQKFLEIERILELR